MFPQIIIFIIKYTAIVSIDHMGLIILIIAFLIPSVGHMYMPVDKKSRVVLVHQSVEDLKDRKSTRLNSSHRT